jgi:hypothetical protein
VDGLHHQALGNVHCDVSRIDDFAALILNLPKVDGFLSPIFKSTSDRKLQREMVSYFGF